MTRVMTLVNLQDIICIAQSELARAMHASADGLSLHEANEISRQFVQALKRLEAINQNLGRMMPDLDSNQF